MRWLQDHRAPVRDAEEVANHPEVATSHAKADSLLVRPMEAWVEGLEWFVTSDLAQWELVLAGSRGQEECRLQPSQLPSGLARNSIPAPASSGSMAKSGAG